MIDTIFVPVASRSAIELVSGAGCIIVGLRGGATRDYEWGWSSFDRRPMLANVEFLASRGIYMDPYDRGLSFRKRLGNISFSFPHWLGFVVLMIIPLTVGGNRVRMACRRKNGLCILWLALVGGALNGSAYSLVVLHLNPLLWFYSAVVGSMCGLLCAPVLMYALDNKAVMSAAMILVPLTISITLLCAALIPAPLSIAVSVGGFILVALCLRCCAKEDVTTLITQEEAAFTYRCRVCDYNLHGLTASRCPECGTPFERKGEREPLKKGPERVKET